MDNLTLMITLCILIIASCTDVQTQKVPNIVTFPAMVVGLIFSLYPNPFETVIRIGWIVVLLVIGSMRIMGMGDLKLCMAVMTLRGAQEASIMLFTGSILLLIYCLVTEEKDTVESIKDLIRMFVYHTGIVKRSDNIYPFAVFLALGYSINFIL